jgi:hypothetical protein
MKKLVFVILLISLPVWAQTKLAAKSATARVDDCAPIGRTAKGELVYSMKCDNLPVPPPPPQVEAEPAPAPPVDSGGLLGRFPLEGLGAFGRSPPGTPPPAAPAGQ